jgi:hypothetical protein
VISIYNRLLFSIVGLLFALCIFDGERKSLIPDDQARVIRTILNKNGYNLKDDEMVDDYLDFRSLSPHVDTKDVYWLKLPSPNSRKVVLSDEINQLSHRLFWGITTDFAPIDIIIIESDSFIDVRNLSMFKCQLKQLPPEIGLLRGQIFNFSDNLLETLPDSIMLTTGAPFLYDTVEICVEYNNIDTLLLTDSLKTWLSNHNVYGEFWWQLQDRYENR